MIARQDHRDFPGRSRNHDPAQVLERALVTGRAGDDVHLAALHAREIAEIVLEIRPGSLVQVGRLRHDVAEQIGARVVEAAGGAIERARHVAAIDAVSRGRAGAGVVVGRDARERGRQVRIHREAVAAVFGTEVRGVEVVAHPVGLAALRVVRGRELLVTHDEVIARVGIGGFTEFGIARVGHAARHRDARRQRVGSRRAVRRRSRESWPCLRSAHASRPPRRCSRPSGVSDAQVMVVGIVTLVGAAQRREELVFVTHGQRRVGGHAAAE